MNAQGYEIHFAPLQGYTDWIYRNNFARFSAGRMRIIPLLYVWNPDTLSATGISGT